MKLATMTEVQVRATRAWASSVQYHNPEMSEDEALEWVLGQIRDGRDGVKLNLVTLRDEPHHVTYAWNDHPIHHWCPGYHDCMACYPD